MTDRVSIGALIQRLQAGDSTAAEELHRDYGQALRVAVRVRLTNPELRRQFDSGDICQSVWRSFFSRAQAGEFLLGEPGELLGLLLRLARCKIAEQARFHLRERRDLRRQVAYDATACTQPGPEQIATGRDFLAALRSRLTSEEWAIAEGRAIGESWPEIAQRLGGTPDGRRKQLSRALSRCSAELDGSDD